jgi:choice-of-anchor A domain-containing protein
LIPLKNQVVSFRDFDVVAFGNLYARGGDVEGRVAVRGNLDVDSFGVGFELWTINGPDNHVPYAVIVGGDATWGQGGGQVWPFGNNIDKHPAQREDIFVGGNFNAPQYQLGRRTGDCGGHPGCLNQWFDAAQNCYTGISQAFAAAAPNADASIVYGGLKLTCNTQTADRYTATVDATIFNQANYYFLDNCNFHAEWVINIVGNGPVYFTGGSFPAVAGGVLFNVPGTGRYLEVRSIGLNAHLLAPGNDLNQTSSVIVGKVVVRNYIELNQVNRPCPNKDSPVVVSAVVASAADFPGVTDDLNTVVVGNTVFNAGDKIVGGNEITAVENVQGGQIVHAVGVHQFATEGTILTVTVTDPFANRERVGANVPTTASPSSSASTLFVGALVVLIALLF